MTETTPIEWSPSDYQEVYAAVRDRYFRNKGDEACLRALGKSVAGKVLSGFGRRWHFKEKPSNGVMDALSELRTARPGSLEQVVKTVYGLKIERPAWDMVNNMEAAVVFAHELGYYRRDGKKEIPSSDTATQQQLFVALQLMEQAKTIKMSKNDAVAQTVFMVEWAPNVYRAARGMLDDSTKKDLVRSSLAAIRDKAAELARSSTPKSILHIDTAIDYLEGRVLLQEGKLAEAQSRFECALTTLDNNYSLLFGISREDVYVSLARVYFESGKFKDAETVLTKGSRELREHTQLDVLANSSDAIAFGYFKRKKDYGAAVGFFRTKAKEQPKDGSVYLHLLQSVVQKSKGKPVEGDLKYANYASGKAVEYTPVPEIIRFVQDRISEKDYITADLLLSKAVARQDAPALVYTTYATLLRARGNEPRARYYDFKAKKAPNK